jgi:hypothetical protein
MLHLASLHYRNVTHGFQNRRNRFIKKPVDLSLRFKK